MTAVTGVRPFLEAINNSISSGRFEDTKIILYSRKDANGNRYKPKALYANSHVLKSVPRFNSSMSGLFERVQERDIFEPIDEDESAKGYNYCSDSDLEDDEDGANVESKPTDYSKDVKNKGVPRRGGLMDVTKHLKTSRDPPTGCSSDFCKKGKVIKIHDTAFITFQAFLFYLYTGRIKFAPYGSGNRESRRAEMASSSEDSIPRPSPKSIYRLADTYGVPRLKSLALESIKNGLGQCDIEKELSSGFLRRYEDVRTIFENYNAPRSSAAEEYENSVFEDSTADEESTIIGYPIVIEVPVKDSSKKTYAKAGELPSQPHPNRVFSPETWKYTEIALIKSIRKGVFFDRKYLTKKSKTGSNLWPVYISSIIADGSLQRINRLVKTHRKGEYLDIGEGFEDSDHGDNLGQSSWFAPVVRGTQAEPLLVLTMGSFASWRSLFLYLCTGAIQFAPLKSQVNDVERITPDQPPPCSPTAIYCLAKELDIKTLRDCAWSDIRSKLTATTVVTEFFSGFAYQQGDITQMQCELLCNEFINNDTATAEGITLIKNKSPHYSGALKLALRQCLLGGVSLRCPNPNCYLHKNPAQPLPRSSVLCPGPNCGETLQCSGCMTPRSCPEDPCCKSCKKQFK